VEGRAGGQHRDEAGGWRGGGRTLEDGEAGGGRAGEAGGTREEEDEAAVRAGGRDYPL
jgi:hypothetical protein